MSDALKPSAGLLCKLGSLAIHIDEFLSSNGHEFDRAVIQTLLDDSEVQEWLSEMDGMAMLPKKR